MPERANYASFDKFPAAVRWWRQPQHSKYSFLTSQTTDWSSSLGFVAAGLIRYRLQKTGWGFWASSTISLVVAMGALSAYNLVDFASIYFIEPVPRPRSKLLRSRENQQELLTQSGEDSRSSANLAVPESDLYPYQPLPPLVYTRLLLLYPAWTQGAPLRGELVDFPYDTPVYFHALSYAWGSNNRDQYIALSGHRLPITANCAAALVNIRPRCTGILVWVDSICINQSDQTERNQQVQYMTKIYANAADTIIWLDDESGVDEIVLRYVRLYAAGKYFRNERLMKWWEKRVRRKVAERGHGYMFAQTIGNSWMFRIWTVQELALGIFDHTWLLCGSQKVQFDHVSLALSNLTSFASLANKYALDGMIPTITLASRALSRIDLGDVIKNDPTPMSKLLQQLQTQRASDPRDRIYGLFAFFDAVSVILPAPSYAKSAPQVYLDAMEAICTHEQNLDLLRLCSGHREADMDTFPTWVPDFRTPGTARRIFSGNAKATSTSQAAFAMSSEIGSLIVHGQIIDVVSDASHQTLWCPEGDPSQIKDSIHANLEHGARQSLEALLDWMHMFFTMESTQYDDEVETFRELLFQRSIMPYTPREDFEDFLTLLTGLDPLETQRQEHNPGPSDAEMLETLTDSLADDPELDRYFDPESPLHHLTQDVYWCMMAFFKTSRSLAQVYHYIWTLNRDVRFFVTAKGFIGTGVPDVRPGDVVALIAGFSYPMVLRARAGAIFEVVGTAFVEGLMDGRYWDSLGSEPGHANSTIMMM